MARKVKLLKCKIKESPQVSARYAVIRNPRTTARYAVVRPRPQVVITGNNYDLYCRQIIVDEDSHLLNDDE